MNTAPKLLESIRDAATYLQKFSDGGQHRHIQGPLAGTCYEIGNQLLDACDKIAALAPPSGDGDQFKLIQQALFALWQSPNDYAARATAQTWLRPEDLAAYRATPQSAPEDGEQSFIDEWESRFGFLATHNNPRSIESIDEVACLLITPPPASQERGGEVDRMAWRLLRHPDLRAVLEYAVENSDDMQAMGCLRRLDRILAASPPSSAAEHRLEMFTKSPGLHEDGCPLSGTPNLYASCDCGLGAAEQAKPDDCPFCGRPGKHLIDEDCPALNDPARFGLVEQPPKSLQWLEDAAEDRTEQAQAWGLPPLPQEVSEVFAADKDGYDYLTPGKCYYTADQMREYGKACREP